MNVIWLDCWYFLRLESNFIILDIWSCQVLNTRFESNLIRLDCWEFLKIWIKFYQTKLVWFIENSNSIKSYQIPLEFLVNSLEHSLKSWIRFYQTRLLGFSIIRTVLNQIHCLDFKFKINILLPEIFDFWDFSKSQIGLNFIKLDCWDVFQKFDLNLIRLSCLDLLT